ncbi:MAG: hypothetical protein ACE5EH_01960 [Gammaproteobacteria bacterium]
MTHLRKNVLTQQYKRYPEMMPVPALGQCYRLYANCCIHAVVPNARQLIPAFIRRLHAPHRYEAIMDIIHDVQIGSIPIGHATHRIIYGFCSKAASKLSGVRYHPGSLVKYSG